MKPNRILAKSQRQLTYVYAIFLVMFVALFTAVPLFIQDHSSHIPRKIPSQSQLPTPDSSLSREIQQGQHRFRTQLIIFNGTFIIIAIAGSYVLARRTLKPLEDVLNKQEAFAAEVAHELKTPLANMLMQISAYKKVRGNIGKNEVLLLNDIAAQIKDLGLTADNILKLMAVDFVDDTLFKEPTNVSTLAAGVIKDFSAKAAEKRISLKPDIAEGAIIQANSLQIKQLINILIDNALKFTPAGGKVFIGVQKSPDHLTIFIEDTGIGIPASKQAEIFNRFYQVETDVNEGSGLGLAIAKRIIDLHHGSIQVASVENTGTILTVNLPIVS